MKIEIYSFGTYSVEKHNQFVLPKLIFQSPYITLRGTWVFLKGANFIQECFEQGIFHWRQFFFEMFNCREKIQKFRN